MIYEATYGNKDGLYNGPSNYKMILLWLYVMEDSFVSLVQRKDNMALLIVAYFAPLLKTMRRAWFLKGWTEHLLASIQIFITEDYASWLAWPIKVAKEQEPIC